MALPEPHVIQEMDTLIRSLDTEALRIADKHCLKSDDGESCRAYHGVRLFLHRIGARGILHSQYQVFYRNLQQAARFVAANSPPIRVLVSGAADFVVPSMIARACEDAGIAASITVLDQCRSPLELCRVASSRLGLVFQYHQGNILDYKPETAFDMVCSDRFFGFFPPAMRSKLVASWRGMLHPNGIVVTTTRIRSDQCDRDRETVPVLNVLESVDQSNLRSSRYPMAALEKMTREYMGKRTAYPVTDIAELMTTFEANNFETCTVRPVCHHEADFSRGKPYSLMEILARSGGTSR